MTGFVIFVQTSKAMTILYHIHTGKIKKVKTYSKDELVGKIKTTTLVWCEGMSEWKEAKDIPDLKDVLSKIPPPLPKISTPIPKPITPQRSQEVEGIKSDSTARTYVKFLIISTLVITLIGVAYKLITLTKTDFYEEAGQNFSSIMLFIILPQVKIALGLSLLMLIILLPIDRARSKNKN